MRTIFFSNAYSAEMRQTVYELAPKGLRLLLSESGTQEETLKELEKQTTFLPGAMPRLMRNCCSAGES